jgi:CBS domain-containing protein
MRATIQSLTGPDLETATASELMTPNPVSINEDATVEEVIAFLADKRYSASPVIDEAGHHLGVVSRSDILRYDRERAWLPPSAEPQGARAPRARDLMTPAVFSVRLATPAARVAEQMVELNVHRLFVVDDDGILVGVITALDLLRHLCGQPPAR